MKTKLDSLIKVALRPSTYISAIDKVRHELIKLKFYKNKYPNKQSIDKLISKREGQLKEFNIGLIKEKTGKTREEIAKIPAGTSDGAALKLGPPRKWSMHSAFSKRQ